MNRPITWFQSLQNRLIVYMTISTLLPLLVLGSLSYQITVDGLNNQANDLTNAIVNQEVSNIEGFVRDTRRLARNLAESTSVKQLVDEANSAEDLTGIERLRLRASIEDKLASTLNLQGLVAIDVVSNNQVFSIGDLSAGETYDMPLLNRWIDSCSSEQTLCWPGIENNTHTNSLIGFVIPAIARITEFDDTSLSYLTVAHLILKYDVEKLYEEVHTESSGVMYHMLVDDRNRVVYHPHKSKLKTLFQFPESPAANSKNNQAIDTEIDGERVRIFMESIPSMGWTLIGIIPVETLERQAIEIGQLALLCFLFALILMITASYYISKKVIFPIERITEVARQRGHSSEVLTENTSIREIRELIHWFNHYKQVVDKEKIQQDELQAAYDDLQRAQQQLVESEKMAALGNIVAGVAHEINTPLGVSITANSILQESIPLLTTKLADGTMTRSDLDAFVEQCRDSSEILRANLTRAAELVTTFKRTAANQSRDHLTDIELVDYIEEVVSSLGPAMRDYSINLSVDGNERATIKSYPGLLWQVFTNLIMNSLNHGFEETQEGRISITVEKEDDQVRIVYQDSGIGILPENLSRIFDPFFTTKRRAGNTGLGLNIVYNLIVQKLQGRIRCESEPGNGVSFFITLPFSIEHADT